jgi:hypothetical protein
MVSKNCIAVICIGVLIKYLQPVVLALWAGDLVQVNNDDHDIDCKLPRLI